MPSARSGILSPKAHFLGQWHQRCVTFQPHRVEHPKCCQHHTAAASNPSQMLNKLCRLADGVQLVNIVRSAEQDAILKAIGANYIVNSTAPNFPEQLAAAVSATGATLSVAAHSNTLV